MTPTPQTIDKLRIHCFDDRDGMSRAAADRIAGILRAVLDTQAECRVIFAAAPSQSDTLDHLIAAEGIDWTRIHAFHMDEYIGLEQSASQLFANFLRRALFERVPFGRVSYLNGLADPEAESARYAALLSEAPIDLCVMGIGENGHIAFNDPPVADFGDTQTVKPVRLDHACRTQQVNDGCFAALDDVPTHALTLTVPTLMAAQRLVCIVPGPTKADAVRATLYGPISTDCPASILRTHADAELYLDPESSAKL